MPAFVQKKLQRIKMCFPSLVDVVNSDNINVFKIILQQT